MCDRLVKLVEEGWDSSHRASARLAILHCNCRWLRRTGRWPCQLVQARVEVLGDDHERPALIHRIL